MKKMPAKINTLKISVVLLFQKGSHAIEIKKSNTARRAIPTKNQEYLRNKTRNSQIKKRKTP